MLKMKTGLPNKFESEVKVEEDEIAELKNSHEYRGVKEEIFSEYDDNDTSKPNATHLVSSDEFKEPSHPFKELDEPEDLFLVFNNDSLLPEEVKQEDLLLEFNSDSINDNIKDSYHCDECVFVTTYKGNLIRHIRRVHSCKTCVPVEAEPKQYCRCGAVLKNRESFLRHIRKMHSNTKMYSSKPQETILLNCSHCNFSTYVKDSLRLHNKVHQDGKMYKCDFCPFSSAYKRSLLFHSMSFHSSEKPSVKKYKDNNTFFCYYCGYSTFRKCHLLHHIKRKHSLKKFIK